jgi:hypothetical protein
VLDRVNRKNSTIPNQQMPVARAEGNRSRQLTLPESKSHIENHQNAVAAGRAAIATSPGPPTS